VRDVGAVLDPSTATMIALGGVTRREGGGTWGVRLKSRGDRDLGSERQFIFPRAKHGAILI
jgi:hypothetical protein